MTDHDLKSYLFVIDSSTMKLSDTLVLIDGDKNVENWQQILPDAAVLVSRLALTALHERLKAMMPRQRFILTRLESGTKNGWLPKEIWSFMNKPTSVLHG